MYENNRQYLLMSESIYFTDFSVFAQISANEKKKRSKWEKTVKEKND